MSNQTASAATPRLAHVDCDRLASTLVLGSERRADFDAMAQSVLAHWQPASPEENFFVETLLVDLWHLDRINRMKSTLLEMVLRDAGTPVTDMAEGARVDAALDHWITSNPKSRFREALRRLRTMERKLLQASGHVEKQLSLLQAERWMGGGRETAE